MAKRVTLLLNDAAQKQLEAMRDHDPHPYLCERAAALLKIAQGQSGREVALKGLLKTRDPDTVYSWVERYEAEGIKGLVMRPGRGRKGAFFPSDT